MLVLPQSVIMKWNPSNRKNLESKNYIFTKYKNEIEVDVLDLSDGCHSKVKVQCDYCGEIYFKIYQSYVNYHEPKGIVASFPKPKFTRLSIQKRILR